MPSWYITVPLTLFLFVIAPFFRKWIDLVVWPRLVDWWAARSQKNLEAKILSLELELKHPDSPHALILDGIMHILLALVFLLTYIAVGNERLITHSLPPWLLIVQLYLAWGYALAAYWIVNGKVSKVRYPDLHNQKLRSRLDRLRKKVKPSTTQI